MLGLMVNCPQPSCLVVTSHKRPLDEEMKKLPQDQFIGWHIWNNERQIQRMMELSSKFGQPIETMVHIHDMAGASMFLRKTLNFFKRIAKLDQDYYPERMGKLEVKDNPQLIEQTVGPKKSFTYKVNCDNKKGDTSIAWYFKATSKDIQFGLKFKAKPHSGWKDNENEIEEIWVEELEPISECDTSVTGFYTPPCPGICTLVWDNSNCKWLSRTIKYHVMVSEGQPIETMVHIHDMAGASMFLRKTLNFFKRIAKLDQDYYPERMGKLEVKDNPQLIEQTVGPKKSFTYKVNCDNKKGDTSIAWYFKATSKDIQFGLKFKAKPHSGWKDNENEIEEIWVEELEPISECDTSVTGFYTPPCPGICTLVWDNSNCKWLSRTIKYHVMVSEVDSDEEISTNGNKENS
ncbi:hypothetical protein AWC38_SpisGene6341 [Stylophora pistillata]|uniref:CRAL-TRIO domain-containing protein n=1 Tax=Stylophora pistillata TaxID=50429 RepID=A0A2B4SK01_STYPI|nr:hypothetical protein AWC38_SpisGene6341 [Stylophora pistillata]